MARLDRRQSLRLLNTAFDAGITHFDTARMYGYGEAESVLGEFLTGRRDAITVTTKVGILPPRRSGPIAMVKPLARRLAAIVPSLRKVARRYGESRVQAGEFDVATMERSLETSLRELHTDHVDMLLLHECRVPDLAREEVLEFLQRSRSRGLIKRFGIGTDIQTVRATAADRGPLADVLQFPSSAFNDNIASVQPIDGNLTITHSSLGPQFGALQAYLGQNPDAARDWRNKLDVDPKEAGVLGRLFLEASLHANPDGVVLFSSSDPKRVERNARLLQDPPASAARLDALMTLARRWADSVEDRAKGETALAS